MRVIIDTNIVMESTFDFNDYDFVIVPIVVVEELDHLKVNKDISKSHQAKVAIRKIRDAVNKEIKLSTEAVTSKEFTSSCNDNRIIDFAAESINLGEADVFLTNDLNCQVKAESVNIPVINLLDCEREVYHGYKEVVLSDEEIAKHYESPSNSYGLLNNEYLIIKDKTDKVIDRQKWTDKGFVPISCKNIKSAFFGNFKPLDAQQMCAIDSIVSNDFTVLTGKAGSGKTTIAMNWIVSVLETNKYTKCIIIYNNAPLMGATQQGFLPGSREEKALGSNLGGILATKLGDRSTVEMWIKQGKIELIPASDIRGIEIGEGEILFITEGQNFTPYILKTAIQRAKTGSKIIVEGDYLEQSDLKNCTVEENGMYRAIEVFKDSQYFGCVKLKNVYRSPLAEIANKM